MNIITLNWKNFQVKLDKVRDHFKTTLSSNYDGLICEPETMSVIFKADYSQEDSDLVSAYWDAVTLASFNPTMQEIITQKIMAAMSFGSNLIIEAAVDNVGLGITQAGKTKVVADYLGNLESYLRTGSLYAAIQEIQALIDDPDRDSLNLSPFITTDRLNSYKAKIITFLSS